MGLLFLSLLLLLGRLWPRKPSHLKHVLQMFKLSTQIYSFRLSHKWTTHHLHIVAHYVRVFHGALVEDVTMELCRFGRRRASLLLGCLALLFLAATANAGRWVFAVAFLFTFTGHDGRGAVRSVVTCGVVYMQCKHFSVLLSCVWLQIVWSIDYRVLW